MSNTDTLDNVVKVATNAVTALQAIFNASVSIVDAERALLAAIKLAKGEEEDDIKRMVYAGRISKTLNYTQEKSLLCMGKRVQKTKGHKGDNETRSWKEEQVYGAARVWFTTFKTRYGLSKGVTRGQAATPKNAMNTEKLKPAPKPVVTTSLELAAYCEALSSRGYDFFLLNKSHSAVMSTMGSELMGAFADHLAQVKEIITKHTPKK